MNISGKIVELWRYPVKSMLGESCNAIDLERRGVAGDRRFAVIDADGKIGSGKDTRRFRKMDGLFSLQAHLGGTIPQIRFPDGRLVSGGDPGVDRVLSDFLGQPVRLMPDTETSYLDAAPVHIVTRGWLARLRDVAPEGLADARRFRPNIVLSTEACPIEDAWLGKSFRIGEAELKISDPTERCAMVTFAQDDLPGAPQILRYIAQQLGLNFGVYAEVVRPGIIRLGDEISEINGEYRGR